jgi:hypothetical protein
MSKLVDRAIDAAGLGAVLAARRAQAPMEAHAARLQAADLLALGALADKVRAEEVGAEVRIHTSAPSNGDTSAPSNGDASAPSNGDTSAPSNGDASAPSNGDAGEASGVHGDAAVVVLPGGAGELTGLDLLREVAIARVTGPRGGHVRIDWDRCGLELAQVALGFGADELVGLIATKRGLPIAEGELLGIGKKSKRELAQVVKRKELADCVARAGRVAVFVRADGAVETALGVVETTPVEEAEPLQEAM